MIKKTQKALVPVSRQAAGEGIVLLENKGAALPLGQDDIISLFGRCQIDTYRSGTGSGGAVNVPYAINALTGLRDNDKINVNEQLVSVYEQWIEQHPFDDGGGGWAAEPWFQQEMPLTEQIITQAAQCSDKAIVFIGRTAGEDQDNADAPGSYRLTLLEEQMLIQVCAAFRDVIVVMNVTNIMDMSWRVNIQGNESIKAVLYSWAAGMEGGHALADVLSGDVSPSGRLSDTIAYHIEDYPATTHFGGDDFNCYVEDIYVGYRYFETFKPEAVQYEFGAGLSYARFTRDLVSYSQTGSGTEVMLNFDIKVKNISPRHQGKEVIQLYCQAPQGQLGKPVRVLIGFSKSKLLVPGESQVIHISIPVKQLASYDDSGVTGHQDCYVIEAGNYNFYLGESVRKAALLDNHYQCESLMVVDTLSEVMAPIRSFKRLKPGKLLDNLCYQETVENVPQRRISLQQRMATNQPDPILYTGNQGIKLSDVKKGSAYLDDFIAQLSEQELATLVRGEGMCSPKVAPGTAAAFGGVSDSLFAYGIPIVAAADGPSGIRMDSGHKATQVPIGTLLSCTWNRELNEKLFNLIGEELLANQIDTLLGPGINIHRHPLNGRNFEYFSEDPLLTGSIASAQTYGLHQAGVSGTIKHFVANDQEKNRHGVDSVVSQRALREIHLKGFELAVKEGAASSIMTSYNPINGHWGASNYDLNTTILREEWRFDGIVMTDWWAKMNHPVSAGEASLCYTSYMLRAQNDLYMVTENDGAESNAMKDDTLDALAKGTLQLGELQRSATNICRFILTTPAMQRPLIAYERIKSIAPYNSVKERDVDFLINEPIFINSSVNKLLTVQVLEEGVYQVSAVASYDRNSLAQSSCSLNLNDTFCMSLPIHGSNGKRVEIEGVQVRLGVGYYLIDVDFVKRGMRLEQLIFIKV